MDLKNGELRRIRARRRREASHALWMGGASSDSRGVTLCGWVALHRIHGGLTFLNLRDQSGIVQVTTLPDEYPEAYEVANKLRVEYVVAVEGTVRARPGESVNKKMETGDIEFGYEYCSLYNKCSMQSDARMQFNLRLRHRVVKLIRRYLEDIHDFVDIETPILSKSTPEGARDYLVPSRVQEMVVGTIYYLQQSCCNVQCSTVEYAQDPSAAAASLPLVSLCYTQDDEEEAEEGEEGLSKCIRKELKKLL